MKIRRSTTCPLGCVKGWTRKIRPSASISTSPSHRLGTSTVTGRPPVRSAIWLTTSCGKVEIDVEGRIFLVQPFSQLSGQVVERRIFIAQVTEDGEVFTDRDERCSPG